MRLCPCAKSRARHNPSGKTTGMRLKSPLYSMRRFVKAILQVIVFQEKLLGKNRFQLGSSIRTT